MALLPRLQQKLAVQLRNLMTKFHLKHCLLLLALFLFLPIHAHAAPTLDATSTSITTGFGAGPVTKTWTNACNSCAIVVLTADIWQDAAGTGSITTAKANGSDMVKVAATRSTAMASEMYYFVATSSGTVALSVTVTGATDAIKMGTASFLGVDTSTPFNASSTAIGTTGNPTASVTTTSDGALVVATLSRFSTTNANTNRTSLFKNAAVSTFAAASYQIAGAAGSQSDTYTGTVTQDWSMIIAGFKAGGLSTTTAKTSATAATSAVIPLTSNPVAGNLLAICTTDDWGATSTVSSITDTLGNTFSRIGAGSDASFTDGEMWYAKNILGGADTVTVNFAHSVKYGVLVREISGLDPTSPLDASATPAMRPGATIHQATSTPTAFTNDLNVGCLASNDGSATISNGAGYGNLSVFVEASSGGQGGINEQATTTAGQQVYKFSTNFSDHGIVNGATFKYLGAGGGVSLVSNFGDLILFGDW